MAEMTGQERTEEATPRKRQQARRKGTVAKSHDLTSAAVTVALLLVMPFALGNLGSAFQWTIRKGFSNIPQSVDSNTVGRYMLGTLQQPLLAFVPILAVAMIVGVAMNFAQVGFVLSGETLTPNLNKINPLSGIKRLFSATAAVDGVKALLKSLLFSYLAWTAIQSQWASIISLGTSGPYGTVVVIGGLLHQIFLRIAIAWMVLAGLDYFFQKKQVDKQLMMTKQELKQEMKEMETSPEVKGAMARRRRALSKARMMEAVKSADVIVTNPTHFSVAIKYETGKMYAPQVVAKGQDLIALKIREIAKEHRVPIVPNPPLARQLYRQCEIGDFVPRDLFQAVAEVLAYVYRTVKKMR